MKNIIKKYKPKGVEFEVYQMYIKPEDTFKAGSVFDL